MQWSAAWGVYKKESGNKTWIISWEDTSLPKKRSSAQSSSLDDVLGNKTYTFKNNMLFIY